MGDVVAIVAVVVAAMIALGSVAAVLVVRRRDMAVAGSELVERHRLELERAVSRLADAAGDQLDTRLRTSATHLETRKELIDAELSSVRRSMEKVNDLVADLEQRRAGQLGHVSEQLQGVARAQAQLSDVTGALRSALTSSQTRGQWGERLVFDVLRAAGFVEGVSFVTQQTLTGGGRPDVTFLLPDDRVLHLDVKFPFANYLSMLEAADDVERQRCEAAFLKDVRLRVKELTTRGYLDPEAGTLDCVLLFIPNEAVAAFLHERDPGLLDVALRQNVVITSPATLFAVLAVIRHTADRLALAETSDEILELLSAFADQWERTTDVLDRLGRGLDTTRRAYDELQGVRSNQLQRHLDEVELLRAGRRGPSDPADAPGQRSAPGARP